MNSPIETHVTVAGLPWKVSNICTGSRFVSTAFPVQKKTFPFFISCIDNPLQARHNEIHSKGMKRDASEARKYGGPGACPRGKFFMTTPFRSLENAPFLENLPLTEAKHHHWWGSFQQHFEKKSLISQGYISFLSCKASKVIALLRDYGSFLGIYTVKALFSPPSLLSPPL